MMRTALKGLLPLGLLVVVLLAPAALAGAGHYLPANGDGFRYEESILLTNGVGNYTGYSEAGFYNGSIFVIGTNPNGTDAASYQSSGTWRNSLGQTQPWSESGSFTFSAVTYHYVQGTDNQTGYVNPYVWFYVNSSAAQSDTVWMLNTPMNVVSTNATFPLPLTPTGYARSLLADGNGSYQRHDVYGTFTATYRWTANFDPTTGYVLGYLYVETDSDGAGDGFTWTDTLTDTQTTFALTSAPAPPAAASPLLSTGLIVLLVLVVLVILLVIVAAIAWRRRSARRAGLGGPLPRHSVSTVPPPPAAPWEPPPIDLVPRNQPTPQVVLRETVRIPCRFCGTLLDPSAAVCPKCGAPRS